MMDDGFKIIRPAHGTGGIFFPIGKPPKGTCEFATEKCLVGCCSKCDKKFPDYDEELLIPEKEKWEIYNQFIYSPIPKLVERIVEEMNGLQTRILMWFASGDCMTDNVEYILKLVKYIKENTSLIQFGFTRNEELWKCNKDVFLLTIDRVNKFNFEGGKFAVPNYRTGKTRIFIAEKKKMTSYGYCGSFTYETWVGLKKIEHHINCQTCYRLKHGCFTPWREDREEL